MELDFNVSIKVRFIANVQCAFSLKIGELQFSSKSFTLHFLKGSTYEYMHRNEIFGTWAIAIYFLSLFPNIKDLTNF